MPKPRGKDAKPRLGTKPGFATGKRRLQAIKLRGGADLYDNPRYRAILFLWQSILAGYVWVWWRETRSIWFVCVLACEIVFVLVFTQWYLSRYLHWGGQLPFAVMIGLILGLWGFIIGIGWWRDKGRA